MPPSFGDQQRDSNIVHRKRNWNVDWMNWMPANRNVQSIWVCFYIFVKNNNVHFQTHWLSLDENTPKAVIAAPDSRMSISVVDMCRENIIGEVGFSPFITLFNPIFSQQNWLRTHLSVPNLFGRFGSHRPAHHGHGIGIPPRLGCTRLCFQSMRTCCLAKDRSVNK